jgi:hypothetical protein
MQAAYILRSRNRPDYEAYEPDSVSAGSVEPDLSIAPVEAWEAVEDVEEALASAPKFDPKTITEGG